MSMNGNSKTGFIEMSAKPETKELLTIIKKLHQIHDYSVLLERVLHEARVFVRADAGTLYLRDKDELFFSYIENDTLFPEGKSEDKFSYADRSIPLNKKSLAGFVALTGESLLIDDVYDLPREYDFSFNPDFDKLANYRTKSQLVLPLMGYDKQNLGVIQLINAQHGGKTVPFSTMDKVHVSFLADHAVLALEKASMTREMVMRMVAIAELQDPYETGNHARRVGEYAVVLYDRFAKSHAVSLAERTRKKEIFWAAALLHDIGKAGVPRDILTKNGHYEKHEKMQMFQHTVFGARLFPKTESLWDQISQEVLLSHHERWDGSGYPGKIKDIFAEPIKFGRGKRGKEIPLSARIVAIADVYDALTSEREYKDAWTPEAAIQFIKSKAGVLFDPELVDMFSDMIDTLKAIRRNFV